MIGNISRAPAEHDNRAAVSQRAASMRIWEPGSAVRADLGTRGPSRGTVLRSWRWPSADATLCVVVEVELEGGRVVRLAADRVSGWQP